MKPTTGKFPEAPRSRTWTSQYTLPQVAAIKPHRLTLIAATAIALGLLAGAPFAFHRIFEHRVTSLVDCATLSGSATGGERARCIECLSGGEGRSFVWDYTPEGRCLAKANPR